ncbi:PIG-P-domain-containing protein, partial [Dunaliella salina]
HTHTHTHTHACTHAALYTAWAFLPESYLHAAGITYYPSRVWAIIIPTWILVLVVFCFWLYEGLNQADVAPFASLHTVKDSRSKAFQDLGLPGVTAGHSGSGVLPLVHIEPTVVSRVLYGGMSVEGEGLMWAWPGWLHSIESPRRV